MHTSRKDQAVEAQRRLAARSGSTPRLARLALAPFWLAPSFPGGLWDAAASPSVRAQWSQLLPRPSRGGAAPRAASFPPPPARTGGVGSNRTAAELLPAKEGAGGEGADIVIAAVALVRAAARRGREFGIVARVQAAAACPSLAARAVVPASCYRSRSPTSRAGTLVSRSALAWPLSSG
ncbi:unnamed protein product [Symbiodinium sp. KB8]|nr:unnamed protein product [Symbiodinium sp. KB8]